MDDLLRQCRSNFCEPPRQFGWWEMNTYLKISKPGWVKEDYFGEDKLLLFFSGQKQLLTQGMIVWGHLIQANQVLYDRGFRNAPGEVVYCRQRNVYPDIDELAEVSDRIAALKNTLPKDPELKVIADYLTDEMVRVFGLSVPHSLSPNLNCAISTVMFSRKHLPNRRLSQSFFPLIISLEEPHVAMLLPSRYWPDELVQIWNS
jgi:hypothetical protein